MPDSPSFARPALRIRAGLAAALLAGLALAPAPAAAWPEDRGEAPPRIRHDRPARPVAPPDRPPPAIVDGYLPRNHGLPMYNEPPGARSSGGPAW